MRTRVPRRLLVLIAVLLATAFAWWVTRPTPPMLLYLGWGGGEADDRPGSEEEYGTLVLRFSDQGVEELSTTSDILLPGDSVPIWMGVATVCTYSEELRTDDFRQVVWRSVGTAREPALVSTCRGRWDEETGQYEGGLFCGNDKARILFAGPLHWTEEQQFGMSSDCEPRGGRHTRSWATQRDSGEVVSLDAVFPRTDLDSLYRVARRSGSDALAAEGFNCSEPHEVDYLQWGIRHARGTWRAFALVRDFAITGECQFDFELPLAVPPSVTGAQRTEPGALREIHGSAPRSTDTDEWSALLSDIRDLHDAVVSPDGRWVLAVTRANSEARLGAYARRGGSLERVWEAPWQMRHSIVSAEWTDRLPPPGLQP